MKYPRPKPVDMSKYPLRSPVVAILGHVDHGCVIYLSIIIYYKELSFMFPFY